MSTATDFPLTPFYIISKANPLYALGFDSTTGKVNMLTPIQTRAKSCLWYAVPTGGVGYLLVQAESGLALCFNPALMPPVFMINAVSAFQPAAFFTAMRRVDPITQLVFHSIRSCYYPPGCLSVDSKNNTVGIVTPKNSLLDSTLFEFVLENGRFVCESITYTPDPFPSAKLVTSHDIRSVIDNLNGANEIATAVSFPYRASTTVSYASISLQDHASRMAKQFGVVGVTGEMLKVDADLSIHLIQQPSYVSSKELSITTAVTQTEQASIKVPVQTAKQFTLKVLQGVIDSSTNIGYQIVGHFESSVPGIDQYPLTLKGQYIGSNTIAATIVDLPDTTPLPGAMLQSEN